MILTINRQKEVNFLSTVKILTFLRQALEDHVLVWKKSGVCCNSPRLHTLTHTPTHAHSRTHTHTWTTGKATTTRHKSITCVSPSHGHAPFSKERCVSLLSHVQPSPLYRRNVLCYPILLVLLRRIGKVCIFIRNIILNEQYFTINLYFV